MKLLFLDAIANLDLVYESQSISLNKALHRRPPALGFTTFNFTFYENPHLSLKKRDFPVT